MRSGILFLAATALLLPLELQAQGAPRRERPPTLEQRQAELPPFCQGDHPRNLGEKAHPKHGADWCERELAGLNRGDDSQQVLDKVAAGIPLEPWCRDGTGHPEFGMAWCQKKEQLRAGGFITFQQVQSGALRGLLSPSSAGVDRSRMNFCLIGVGHPEFGMEWCTMTEAEWARRQERARGGPGGEIRR